jgi:hypothetical protein
LNNPDHTHERGLLTLLGNTHEGVAVGDIKVRMVVVNGKGQRLGCGRKLEIALGSGSVFYAAALCLLVLLLVGAHVQLLG